MPKEVKTPKHLWDESFKEQISRQAYNTAPVEALIRNTAYYLRGRFSDDELDKLHFFEMGCGAGPNLKWLAQQGITVSGVDISPKALELCRNNFTRSGLSDKVGQIIEASVGKVPFEDESFDGILEACVFQHLEKEERKRAFSEVKRLLKPGGLFAGYMLDQGHTIFQQDENKQLNDDPGTLICKEDKLSKFHLGNLGLCHFYTKEEIIGLLDGFSVVDPCLTTYYLPMFEAEKRGYSEYKQSMWAVYAVK